MLVNTSTDDFLCAYSSPDIFYSLEAYLKGHFGVTKVEGSQFEYLNLRITQSSYGISFDQTDHIIDTIVSHFFPPDTTDVLKKVHTPFRTDSQFEADLAEQLPATKEQLGVLVKQYKGSFPKIIGMLMHVYCWSRNDLGYALMCLSRYIQAPSRASFEGFLRLVRYLATH